MTGATPLVSVVIPIHNVAPWIEGVVASVLRSSVDLELIVVNDATPDASADLARAAIGNDPRGRVMNNVRTRGGDGARNTGLDMAEAPYVLFLDGDDELADGGLAALVEALMGNDAFSAVCGSFDSRDEHGAPMTGGWEAEHRRALVSCSNPARAEDFARAQLAPPPGAILMRTDLVRAVGGWDEGHELSGLATDSELLARLSFAGPLAMLPDRVLHYCVRPTSLSRRRDHPRKFFRARVLAIKRAPRSQRLSLGVATAARSWQLAKERFGDWRQPSRVARGVVNALHALTFLTLGLASTLVPTRWSEFHSKS